MSNPLPPLLRFFRQKRNLTQQKVADALAISRSGYANYEEGRTLPSIEQTIRLSELFNHDLLYAYTLSSRYMQAKWKQQDDTPIEMVMEANTYIASLQTSEGAVSLLENFKKLDTKDKKLVENFVEALSEKVKE